MKKLVLLFVVTLLLFTNCNENTEDFVLKIAKESKKHASISYKVTKNKYSPSIPDTSITPFKVWVVRDSNDTLKNGYIWVDNYYRPYNMIYDAGDFYLAIPPKQTTIYDPGFKGAFISQVDWIDIFLNPDALSAQIIDPAAYTIISDTIYQGKICTKLVIEFRNEKKKELKKYTYVIDQESLVPLWARLESKSRDLVFYDELLFADYEFDNVDLEKLKERQKKVLSENPIGREESNSEVSRLESMLHTGDKAPLFSGNFYPGDEDFKLADYIGKNVIIVDFWYTHCPPCVKAMPALSDLYTKYKDRGLKIFGLNSVDNQPHSLDYFKTFLGKRQISYDIILTNSDVDIMYKINGYPTMYVVDKDGKIAFVEVGFDEEKLNALIEIIEELTK